MLLITLSSIKNEENVTTLEPFNKEKYKIYTIQPVFHLLYLQVTIRMRSKRLPQ